MRDDVHWSFPGECGVSETSVCYSRQASMTSFPHVSHFTKDDDMAKTDPVQCCFLQNVYGLFVSLPHPLLIGFSQEAKIALEAVFAKFCFSVLCSSGFTHGTKAP